MRPQKLLAGKPKICISMIVGNVLANKISRNMNTFNILGKSQHDFYKWN